jgi:hypothetical protein
MQQAEEQLKLDLEADGPCFVYIGDDVRSEQQALSEGRFTDALPIDAVRHARQIALVSWSGSTVDAVALLTRRARVAQLKRRVVLSPLRACASVPFSDLWKRVPPSRRKSVMSAFGARGGQLEVDDCGAVRAAVLRMGGELAEAWLRIEALLARRSESLWPEDREPVVAYERDAVGLALEIADLDRSEVLARWTGAADEPFVHGLAAFKLYERAILASDMRVFGDWEAIEQWLVGSVRFEKGGRRLTIVNVNETDVEHALGCDLIYYDHTHCSYVLVQYKRLGRDAMGRWEFRPSSDPRFDDQLARMAAISQGGRSAAPDAYRLGEGFCFVKLCESVTRNPVGGELSAGMYLPIEYLSCLRAAGAVRGSRGGEVIRYDNVRRWINNTFFVSLVERAWVGTRGLTTTEVEKVIRAALEAGDSIVLAASAPASA